jgi:ectoine hydroxylase
MTTEHNSDTVAFHRDGFCQLPYRFSHSDIQRIAEAIDDVISARPPGLVYESDSSTVRALQGAHLLNRLLGRLAQDRRLLCPAKQLLHGDVYLHQFKVNFKQAFVGGAWPWHQDFAYWRILDGIPDPHLVSAMIALDEISEFNGPVFFIRGSHNKGLFKNETTEASEALKDLDRSFSSDLPFQLMKEDIASLLQGSEIVAPKGPPGSVIFFAANTAHASLPNLTPDARRIVLITYNRVDNVPLYNYKRRPEYIAGSSFQPLQEIVDFTSELHA